MAKEIIEIIDMLPRYITYIYPGFITIWVYSFIRAKRFIYSKSIVFLSIGISFFYIVFAQRFIIPFINCKLNIKYINFDVSDISFNIVLFLISIVIPYLINIIVRWDKIDKVLQEMYIQTSISDNEFDALQTDYTNSIFITVYIKNSTLVYSGYAKQKEMDKDSRRFICLWKFRKFEVTKKIN